MIRLDAVAAFDPPDLERGQADYVDGGYGPRAEAERLAVLRHLRRARACLAGLSDAVRGDPDNDVEADAWIETFAQEADRAGTHLEAFRLLRECKGEGDGENADLSDLELHRPKSGTRPHKRAMADE